MKSYFIIALILFSSSNIYSQVVDKTQSISHAELQTNELCDFLNLNADLRAEILLINLTCDEKNKSLGETDMHPETIKKGKIYNEEDRAKSIKKLLTPAQVSLLEKFENTCRYCK